MIVYVELDSKNKVIALSTNKVEDINIEVRLESEIDLSSLFAYRIEYNADFGENELVYDQNLYDKHLAEEEEEERKLKASELFNELMIENVLKTVSNAQAEILKDFYPTFKVGKDYKIGDRFSWNGKLWEVLLDHTSAEQWMPDTATSLYKEVKA